MSRPCYLQIDSSGAAAHPRELWYQPCLKDRNRNKQVYKAVQTLFDVSALLTLWWVSGENKQLCKCNENKSLFMKKCVAIVIPLHKINHGELHGTLCASPCTDVKSLLLSRRKWCKCTEAFPTSMGGPHLHILEFILPGLEFPNDVKQSSCGLTLASCSWVNPRWRHKFRGDVWVQV